MLVLTLAVEHGHASYAGGAISDLPGPLSLAIPAHTLALISIATGAQAGSNGPSAGHTLTDDLGTTYTKLAEVTRIDDTGFRPGVTESVWMVRKDTAIPAGTVLTPTLGTPSQGVVWSVVSFNPHSAGNVIVVDVSAPAHGSADGSSDPVVTLTPAASDDITWVGAFAFDSAANLTLPLTPGWYVTAPQVGNAGGHGNGVTLVQQYRIVEAQSQDWEIMDTLGGRRWVGILVGFALAAPATAPVAGTREFLADFDTATDGVVRASTALFPDAIVMDFRSAHSWGPATLNDPTGGVEARSWEVVALATSVTIAGENIAGNGYDVAVELFPYSGAVIDYICLAFSASGRPVVVCQRGTGTAGAPEVWLYWWDGAAFAFDNLGPGRTPRAVLDAFPHLSAHCAPTPDVQVVYLKPGSGLVRLEEREDFATVHGSPLPYVENIGILEFYPSTARELVVVYGRHNVLTGRWEGREVVSLPYDDSLLKRPSFGQPAGDLLIYRGQPFYNPAVGSSTDPYTLRVNSVEAVDVIELQCANSLPGGAQPADTGGIWTEQVQESPGAVGAGGGTTFTINVTHGGGTMGPRSFRARTRKVIGATTCWSPWRYFVVSSQGNPADFDVDGTLVNCGHDHVVCLPGPGAFIFEWAHGELGTHFCDSEAHVSSASACSLGGGGFFVGGWFTGIGWRQDWAVQLRSRQAIAFTDPDGVYTFVLDGDVFIAWSSGAGWPLPNPNQSPMQIPA